MRIVLAHVTVVCGTETDGRLFAFMADINADKHGLVGYFFTELHAPEITTELSVHLPNDIQEDTVVILSNSSVRHELRYDRRVTVDLVLQE